MDKGTAISSSESEREWDRQSAEMAVTEYRQREADARAAGDDFVSSLYRRMVELNEAPFR